MGLTHAHAAIEKEWIVSLGWAFRHGLGCRMRKLIACADHECVEGVLGTKLCCGVPVKPLLLARGMEGNAAAGGDWSKAAVRAHGRRRGIFFRCNELYILIFRRQGIHGFLDQIAEFVADIAKVAVRSEEHTSELQSPY